MADYQTYLTTKNTVIISQYRHNVAQAIDLYLLPHPAADNDLRAIITGTVVHSGYGEDSTYGISVTYQGSGEYEGYFIRYAHLSYTSVAAGQSLALGDFIGYEGTTGRVTGQHLHLEIYYNNAPASDSQYQSLLGFPILPIETQFSIEYGGPEPPIPPTPPSLARKHKIYYNRGDDRRGFRFSRK